MNQTKTLPRIPGPNAATPKHPLHGLDRLMGELENARPLFERIKAHQIAFKDDVAKKGFANRLRDFEPTNPLEEWYDSTDEPMVHVGLLQRQGLIATIRVAGRYYSRPAA